MKISSHTYEGPCLGTSDQQMYQHGLRAIANLFLHAVSCIFVNSVSLSGYEELQAIIGDFLPLFPDYSGCNLMVTEPLYFIVVIP